MDGVSVVSFSNWKKFLNMIVFFNITTFLNLVIKYVYFVGIQIFEWPCGEKQSIFFKKGTVMVK